MKIQNRIKSLQDVVDCHWDSRQNRLVIYYDDSLFTVQIRVCEAIGLAGLQRAIDTITFVQVLNNKQEVNK